MENKVLFNHMTAYSHGIEQVYWESEKQKQRKRARERDMMWTSSSRNSRCESILHPKLPLISHKSEQKGKATTVCVNYNIHYA